MFRELSIRHKLAMVLWGTSLLVYAAAGIGLALFQSLTLERRVRQIMEPYAHLVAVGSDVAVAFEDSERAQEILNTLRSNPQILQADLILSDGRILASFSTTPHPQPPPLKKPAGVYLGQGTGDLLQDLPQGARFHLIMSLSRLSQQAHQIYWIFGAAVLGLLAVTLGQLAVLQRAIVRPIANLTEAAELFRLGDTYNYCVPASGYDEVARLGQSFNAMITTVQQRENDLQRLTIFQRTLLDNAAYSIISTTPEGVITSFNPAASHLLGYTGAEMIGGETPLLWHDPDEVARRARELSDELGERIEPGFEVFAARARRNLPDEYEWTFRRKDGSEVPVLLSVTALRDECGEITGFVGLAKDLTERKRAEAELRESEQRYRQLNETLEQRIDQAVAELQQRNRMLIIQSRQAVMGEMLSNIAHQWRQPLNTLALLAQELQMTCRVSGFSQEFLDANVGKTMKILKHMSGTIDDFRYFFRQGKVKESFKVREVLERALSLLEASLAEHDIRVRIETMGDPVISGYPNEFSQVLVNILTNARDAFALRKVTEPLVTIKCFAEGGKTVVTVTDNAGGIDEAIIEKVFEPYFTTKGPEQGTGIGLFMCKTIVEKNMNGSISVRNVEGGAEFRIEL